MRGPPQAPPGPSSTRPRTMRIPPKVLLNGILLCTFSGCADTPAAPVDGPSGAPAMKISGDLVPGAVARVTGSNLSRLSSITVDGREAALERVSDAELRFVVPELRACETDGRKVVVRGKVGERTSIVLDARISTPSTFT